MVNRPTTVDDDGGGATATAAVATAHTHTQSGPASRPTSGRSVSLSLLLSRFLLLLSFTFNNITVVVVRRQNIVGSRAVIYSGKRERERSSMQRLYNRACRQIALAPCLTHTQLLGDTRVLTHTHRHAYKHTRPRVWVSGTRASAYCLHVNAKERSKQASKQAD